MPILRPESPFGRGLAVIRSIDANGRTVGRPRVTENTWVYTYGLIAAKAIGLGDRNYRIQAMYIEFENLDSPGSDPVAIPTFAREDGLEYYNALSSDPTRDFLRVQLTPDPYPVVATDFEFPDIFGTQEGNALWFRSRTAGSVGVHGKTFSHTVFSKVYGIALVATPEWEDRTLDIVYGRAYYEEENQMLKEDGQQVAADYKLEWK